MFAIKEIYRDARSLLAAMAVAALGSLALIGASGDANAGYTCTTAETQVGNSVTFVVSAVSGGSSAVCGPIKSLSITPNISASASVTSAQVGATTDLTEAWGGLNPRVGPLDVRATCTHPAAGSVCSDSVSDTINGVNSIYCRIFSLDSFAIPAPALPLVPVTFTTTCTINY